MVATLLLATLLLVLASTLLHTQAQKYRGAALENYRVQAIALAEAGLEDARVKLEKDGSFPPVGSDEQTAFEYTEKLPSDGPNELVYQVVIDTSRRFTPHQIIQIRSTGRIGPTNQPLSIYTLKADLDASPNLRSGGGANPNFFRYIYLEQCR